MSDRRPDFALCDQCVCNHFARLMAILVRRNFLADLIEGRRHIGYRRLIRNAGKVLPKT
jgi:hypothetical protein